MIGSKKNKAVSNKETVSESVAKGVKGAAKGVKGTVNDIETTNKNSKIKEKYGCETRAISDENIKDFINIINSMASLNPADKPVIINAGLSMPSTTNHKSNRINNEFFVEVINNLDIKDVGSATKYYIRIGYKNNYINIDLFNYNKFVRQGDNQEYELLNDAVLKLTGRINKEQMLIIKSIAEYISSVNNKIEPMIYTYSMIGFDNINDVNVFKYDCIYENSDTVLKGYCNNSWVAAIKNTALENKNETVKSWRGKISNVINNYDVSGLLVAAGISGLIRQNLVYGKEENIDINICGHAASGKSTIENLILSFFGNPAELMGSFLNTENAEDIIMSNYQIIPYVIDERMLRVLGDSDKKKQNAILESIFRSYNGRVKSTAVDNENAGVITYAPVISSSVDNMIDMIKDTKDIGQYRRFIEITVGKPGMALFKDASQAVEINKLAHEVYGYGILEIVFYILSIKNNILIDEYDDIEDILKAYDSIYEDDIDSKEIDTDNNIDKNVLISNIKNAINNIDNENIRKLDFDYMHELCKRHIEYLINSKHSTDIYDMMESSISRFALIELSARILNHASGFKISIDSIDNILIKNLHDKLVSTGNIKIDNTALLNEILDYVFEHESNFWYIRGNNKGVRGDKNTELGKITLHGSNYNIAIKTSNNADEDLVDKVRGYEVNKPVTTININGDSYSAIEISIDKNYFENYKKIYTQNKLVSRETK